MKERKFKISDKGVSYTFNTPEELQAFVIKKQIKSSHFFIVDLEQVSDTCVKETEILKLKAEW